MKKLRLLLTLIAVSIGAMQSAWARTAPVFPEAQTLESGQTYYLYNVGSNQFVYRNNSDVYANATTKTGITITAQDNGYYTMQFSDNGFSLYVSDYLVRTNNNQPGDYTYFRIAETEGGYTIQRNYNYDATLFVGIENGESYVYSNRTDGNIVWQLFDKNETDYYYAKKALYDALESATGYESVITHFEAIYDSEASTTAELNAAATDLNKSLNLSRAYKASWWNERPLLFHGADGSWSKLTDQSSGKSYLESYLRGNSSGTISATVLVEEPSTLVYGLRGSSGWTRVTVDGTEVRALHNVQNNTYPSHNSGTRFFEELEPGLHTITWTFSNYASTTNYFYLLDVSVMSKPQITVSLLEPGSLGTEVLYNTDHIKNVRRLKVKGAMNSDDWAKIKMMSTLLELDLSEAQFTEIPASQFSLSSDTTMNFLHKVVLPEGLKTIGDYAFYYSFVEDINLPSTMRRVGKYAFGYSHVKELIMPDDMTDFYGGSDDGYCFYNMVWLKKLVMPKNLTRIPRGTFYRGYYITEAVMPEKLQTVGRSAFSECERMQAILPEGLRTIEESGFYDCPTLNSPLPSTLTTIGKYAFRYARGFKSLVIPQSVTSIGESAFSDCSNLEKVELSVNQYSLADEVFKNCGKLTTMKLNSPTVTTISQYYPLTDITKVTLQVPHYLVNEYKLHSYWYNAKAIEPFDYSSIGDIHLYGRLTLNHERFGGQPNIVIHSGNNYLKINGDSEQRFNNIQVNQSGSSSSKTQLLNNCDNITASGDNLLSYGTESKKWYFISLPFDLDVSRITPDDGVQYAIRYYDGEGRAANGKSGNWKNVDRTSIIPAGTGFIFQTNNSSWTWFYAADTENKYGTLRTTEFTKTLDVNASETASNRGWNLVGNPYQCFYNNHCLNFTAPITVWNGSTYTAYSLTDDDYAIRPNEAFFVQCPNEEYATIGFPLQGRQLTSVIESQNAARRTTQQAESRKVVNLTIGNGETEDMTRVVLNELASTDYEISCDASKFMSIDESVPQIYTLDAEGTQYAINERPLGEGTVALGFYAGKEGLYTIAATRCDAESVLLTDKLHGTTTELTEAPYTFSAEAGQDNARFTLSFLPGEATGVQDMEKATDGEKAEVFSTDGKFLGTDIDRLGTGVYIVRQGKKVSKVVLH